MVGGHTSNQVSLRSGKALISPRLPKRLCKITKKQIRNNPAIAPEPGWSQPPGVCNQLPLSHVCFPGSPHSSPVRLDSLSLPSHPASISPAHCVRPSSSLGSLWVTPVSPSSSLHIKEVLQRLPQVPQGPGPCETTTMTSAAPGPPKV